MQQMPIQPERGFEYSTEDSIRQPVNGRAIRCQRIWANFVSSCCTKLQIAWSLAIHRVLVGLTGIARSNFMSRWRLRGYVRRGRTRWFHSNPSGNSSTANSIWMTRR